MRSRTTILPLTLVLALCAWQAHAQEMYRLTKIEGLTSFGGLNRNGVVVGATRAANGAQHAAVWQLGHLTDIHNRIDSNAVESDVRGVNDKLDLVGTFVDPITRGFLLSGRHVTEIKPPPGDQALFATGINDRKQVIGTSLDPSFSGKSFVWERGRFTILEGLDGRTLGVETVGISDRGIVAGSDNLAQRAVMWQSGTVMDIGGLPGSLGNQSGAINDVGQIAGQSILTEANGPFQQQTVAFVWRDGVVTALPSLFSGLTGSHTLGINSRGVVVGESVAEFAEEATATVWVHNAVFDLTQLVDPNDPLKSTVTLLDARAINDRGQIVAGARAADFSTEFYLLTPVR